MSAVAAPEIELVVTPNAATEINKFMEGEDDHGSKERHTKALEEWLKRIPHFAVDPDQPVRMQAGIVGSIASLPLTWDVAETAPS